MKFQKFRTNIMLNLFLLAGVMFVIGFASYYFIYQKSTDARDVSRIPASIQTPLIESQVDQMIGEARRMHIIEDYKSTNEILNKLLSQYPDHAYTTEAYYLLAKGQWYENLYDQSLSTIDLLWEYSVNADSKWHGYALLIKGKIYEERGRKKEAIQLYRKVITEFPEERDLVNEAEDILMEVSI